MWCVSAKKQSLGQPNIDDNRPTETPNPHLRGMSLNGDTLHHIMRWHVGGFGCAAAAHPR